VNKAISFRVCSMATGLGKTTSAVAFMVAAAAADPEFSAVYVCKERRLHSTAQIVGDITRVSISDGVQTSSVEPGVTRIGYDQEPIRSPDRSSNIVTARSSGGRSLSGSDIGPDAIIRVGDTETSVRAALLGGLVRHNAAGVLEYADGVQPAAASVPATPATPDQPQSPPAEPEPTTEADYGERYSDAAEAVIEHEIASIGGAEREAAITQMVETGGGLLLGFACIIGGLILFLHGISGSTRWIADGIGLKSEISDAGPGAVLFVVGVFIIVPSSSRMSVVSAWHTSSSRAPVNAKSHGTHLANPFRSRASNSSSLAWSSV